MDHARTLIRDALVVLLGSLATTGARCKADWPYPTAPGELPALRLFLPREQRDDGLSDMGSKIGRSADLVVIGYAQGVLVADTLDTIAAEVETAIAADPTLGGAVKQILYQGTTVEIDGDGHKRAGEIRLTFAVRYRTRVSDPSQTVS